MKSTGIVRRVDELGRIVLPIELRRTLDIAEKDSLEIYVDGASIVLKKYQPACVFCDDAKDVINFKGKNVVFFYCLAGIMIPGPSIMITQLYLDGMLSFGAMMAGLLVGAGVGLLVLYRTNAHLKENIKITGILYAGGVLWGILFELLHIVI